MDNVLNTNAKLEGILANLGSVVYVELNNNCDNIEYFNGTNVHQYAIAEI